MRTQIMEHTAVNGSVHTDCTQHQRVCTQICLQICLRVLCEQGLKFTWEVFAEHFNGRSALRVADLLVALLQGVGLEALPG